MSDELVEAVARAISEATSGPFEFLSELGRDSARDEARAAIAIVIERVERELDKCGEPCPVCHEAIRKLGESE